MERLLEKPLFSSRYYSSFCLWELAKRKKKLSRPWFGAKASRSLTPNLWSAANNQMVRGCVHLLNKNNCLWHCDITYKSVVRNLYVVGKVVLGCKKVWNHYYKLPTRLRRFGWISDTETDYVQLPQGEFLYRTHSNRILRFVLSVVLATKRTF